MIPSGFIREVFKSLSPKKSQELADCGESRLCTSVNSGRKNPGEQRLKAKRDPVSCLIVSVVKGKRLMELTSVSLEAFTVPTAFV